MEILIKEDLEKLSHSIFITKQDALILFMKGRAFMAYSPFTISYLVKKYIWCFTFYYVSVYLGNMHVSAHSRGHRIIGTEVTGGWEPSDVVTKI